MRIFFFVVQLLLHNVTGMQQGLCEVACIYLQNYSLSSSDNCIIAAGVLSCSFFSNGRYDTKTMMIIRVEK